MVMLWESVTSPALGLWWELDDGQTPMMGPS
jgi:hypothetical protein